uniref:Endonuclease/exonuclease/phosphatase domain-containing protein n=1 Tax=Kalanchoe fedtschenkoi TaxID=63787 RepID=A0A7N0TB96_KALFE
MCLCILEPKVSTRRIKNLSRRLGFQELCYDHDTNHHIAIMWKNDVTMSLNSIDDQFITLQGLHSSSGQNFFLSVVYVSCSKHARRRIWSFLLSLNSQINDPWIVGGDFNVISSWNEKNGGRIIDNGSMQDLTLSLSSLG